MRGEKVIKRVRERWRYNQDRERVKQMGEKSRGRSGEKEITGGGQRGKYKK